MLGQLGVTPIIEWAVMNSDPANLLLLAGVYIQLKRNHRDLTEQVDDLQRKVAEIHGESETGETDT